MAAATTTGTQPGTNAVPAESSKNGPIYIETQHDDMVHDAQLDYYGCKLATSSSGKTRSSWKVAVASPCLTKMRSSFENVFESHRPVYVYTIQFEY